MRESLVKSIISRNRMIFYKHSNRVKTQHQSSMAYSPSTLVGQYLRTFANRLSKGKISLLLVHIGSNKFPNTRLVFAIIFSKLLLNFPGKISTHSAN
ncbi:hypothetical protein LWI29_035377 [Acer saccharum]|uniref:Uncharacterized protein n=1 Tax=Acer saccharum TaxID=4024 RepID=A0AA39RQ25_ACESA|nr:hypothetical protein LWI29_035377 [Acer saccharum]